jgi:iron complex outermembrane receptor protein
MNSSVRAPARAGHSPRPSHAGGRSARGGAALLLGAFAAAGALGGLPGPARADETVVAADLGEVVVTARRRDEKIIDVPLAVTVETAEQLKEQDAVLFDDVARAVPNLRMMPSPESVSAMDVTLRGQTALRSAIAFDPAVGIYVDGVYVAEGQGAMSSLLDIDSVEIVRGAQGTLFGRDNTGGSISFATHRPQLGAYTAELAADAGADRLFVGRGIVNVPVGETLAFRLAYQDDEREGYGSSLASGQGNFGNEHRYELRLGGLWRPNPQFDAYWTYDYMEAKEVGALLHPLGGTQVAQLGQLLGELPQLAQFIPGLVPVAPVVLPTSFYQTDADLPSHDDTHVDATQLTLTQALGDDARAKLILGYRHLNNNTAIDVDATSLPFANTLLMNSSSQKSAELQISGAALDRKLNWVGGLYWFRDDGSSPSVLQPASAAYITDFTILYQAGIYPSANLPVSPYAGIVANSLENLSSAGFVHGDYQITDRWAAAAGVRRTDDTRRLDENSYAYVPGFGQSCQIAANDTANSPPANNGGPCPPVDRAVSFSYWSWELSTRYRLTEDINSYFRTGRAQRSGGWNEPMSSLQDTPFRPEELTDYEVGLKSRALGGALLFDGDLFYGNYDDMQRLLPRLVGGTPVTYVVNAGKARVSGAELESALALSRSWSAQLAFGWTDARYVEFQYAAIPGQPGVDLSGNQFDQTPRFNVGVGLGYERPLITGRMRLHADYAWQDAVQFNTINDFNSQGAYGTLNARGTFVAGSGGCEVSLFGTNLTNRQYAITGGSVAAPPSTIPAISWQIPGAPRLWGLELLYRFGNKT